MSVCSSAWDQLKPWAVGFAAMHMGVQRGSTADASHDLWGYFSLNRITVSFNVELIFQSIYKTRYHCVEWGRREEGGCALDHHTLHPTPFFCSWRVIPPKERMEGPREGIRSPSFLGSPFSPSSPGRRQVHRSIFTLMWIWKMCKSERPHVDSEADPENQSQWWGKKEMIVKIWIH